MKPISIPAELLASITAGFLKFGAQRCDDPLLHHLLVERAEGRVIFAVTNLASALIYLHLPAPLPLTEIQRKMMSVQWRADASRFLVPLADLHAAAKKARGLVSIAPGDLRCGPMPLGSFTTPDVNDFPRILPPLDELKVGFTTRRIHTGRVDPTELGDE
ncbi:MAG: hypothetical protein WCF18_18560 [Chthoniobacteraceae bacterium]